MSSDSDEVDALVEAWASQRPDLSCGAMQVWSRLTRLADIFERHRSHAFSEHGLVGWQFDVLAALRRSGAPFQMSPGRLMRETFVTSGTMTNRVNRLDALGLVRRDPDPVDGRGVLVTLTDDGLAVVDAAFESLLRIEEELLSTWSGSDRDALADYLRLLLSASS